MPIPFYPEIYPEIWKVDLDSMNLVLTCVGAHSRFKLKVL